MSSATPWAGFMSVRSPGSSSRTEHASLTPLHHVVLMLAASSPRVRVCYHPATVRPSTINHAEA